MASFVFALVRGHLAGGGKGEAAALAYAVEMVGGFAVDAAFVLAFLIFVKLLEAVLGVSVIFDVIALVLLYVTLVLEGEGTPGAPEAGKIDGLNCKSTTTTYYLARGHCIRAFTCSGSGWSSARKTGRQRSHNPRWPGTSGSHR